MQMSSPFVISVIRMCLGFNIKASNQQQQQYKPFSNPLSKQHEQTYQSLFCHLYFCEGQQDWLHNETCLNNIITTSLRVEHAWQSHWDHELCFPVVCCCGFSELLFRWCIFLSFNLSWAWKDPSPARKLCKKIMLPLTGQDQGNETKRQEKW